MSDEQSVDPGLAELTADVLGPAPDATSASSDAQTSSSDDQAAPVEQSQTASDPAAQSAQAPTAAPAPVPQAPDDTFIEIDGRKFNRNAVEQTLRQFPHLQRLYVEQKQREQEWQRAQEAERARTQAPQQVDPRQVQAQIRASFDQVVQKAVSEGFIEEEFTQLYPNLAANMLMQRDAQAFVAKQVTAMYEEIQGYKNNLAAERVKSDVLNNMVALSTTDQAMAKLSDPAEREGFFNYLVALSPRREQLLDPGFYRAQYVAYHGNDFLSAAEAARAQAKAKADQAAAAKRQLRGVAVGSARVAAAPEGERERGLSRLDEMLADKAQRDAGR